MANITLPNDIQNGQPGDAAPVMANFNALANFINSQVLHVDGSVPLAGNWSAGGNRITALADPTGEQDAASKNYVDASVANAMNASNISLGVLAADHGGTGRANVWNTVSGVTPSPTASQRLVTVASDGRLAVNPNPLSANYIPNLNASKITAGEFSNARIPLGLRAGTNSATFSTNQLNTDQIRRGNGASTPRVEMLSSGIRVLDGGGEFGFLGGQFQLYAGGSPRGVLEASTTGGGRLYVRGGTGEVTISPSTVSCAVESGPRLNLGSSEFRWGTLFTTTNPNVSSDRRLKKAIEPIDPAVALGIVEQVPAVTYQRLDDGDDRTHHGWVAQDLQGAAPALVETGEDGMLSIAPSGLTAVLWAAVQVLAERVEALEAGCACR